MPPLVVHGAPAPGQSVRSLISLDFVPHPICEMECSRFCKCSFMLHDALKLFIQKGHLRFAVHAWAILHARYINSELHGVTD